MHVAAARFCGKQVEHANRPFCSQRCKMLDLGRWLDEGYRLPSEQLPDEAEIIPLSKHLGRDS